MRGGPIHKRIIPIEFLKLEYEKIFKFY